MKRSLPFLCILLVGTILLAAESDVDRAGEGAKKRDDSMLGKEAGQERSDNGIKMTLVWCPPGEITMEDVEGVLRPTDQKYAPGPNDRVRRVMRRFRKITLVDVTLTRGFWLGKYEVTQSEWMALMASEPWGHEEAAISGDHFPAAFVNWEEAMEFCRRLTKREREAGRLSADWGYTLPSEAQWERACRAGTETRFSFGDDEARLAEYAWYNAAPAAAERHAHRVGEKKANTWGLYDVHGNVWEWCRDSFAAKLPGGRDPIATEGTLRVIRGGGWDCGAAYCGSAFRLGYWPGTRDGSVGFRVALGVVR